MQTAVILRVSRAAAMGEPHVWYEYALLVNNQIERQSPHMMATAESAARSRANKGMSPAATSSTYSWGRPQRLDRHGPSPDRVSARSTQMPLKSIIATQAERRRRTS